MTAEQQHSDTMGTTGKVALVHKDGAEGALAIDAITGQVLPNQHDRPDWAEGLVAALLAERHGFYAKRLGSKYADEHAHPEAYQFADLGWVGVDAEGLEVELAADDEYRMDVLAKVLGADRESGTIGGTIAEHEIARDANRSADEAKALEEDAMVSPFRKTGTHEA